MKSKLIWLFVVALVMRLFTLRNAIAEDEVVWMTILNNFSPFTQLGYIIDNFLMQMPLSLWLMGSVTSIFSANTLVMRIVLLVFSLLTVYLTYLMAKRSYGDKGAFYALLLMVTSFYFIYTSAIIEIDVFLLFFFVLALYMFFRYLDTGKFMLFGLSLGLALMTRYNAALLYVLIPAYLLFNGKSIKETFVKLWKPFAIGIGVVLVYVLGAYVLAPEIIRTIFEKLFYFSASADKLPLYVGLVVLVIWATPLLLGLPLLSILKREKKDNFYWIWIVLVVLVNLYISKGGLDRYFTLMIPALCILGGKYLAQFKLDRKEVKFGLVLGGALLVLMFVLNSLLLPGMKYLPKTVSAYVGSVLSFDLNFFYPMLIDHGPWFGMNMWMIVIGSVLGFGLLIGAFALRKKKVFRKIVVLFLAVSMSYNVFLVSEYLFSVTQPDYNDAVYDVVHYFDTEEIEYPLYATSKDMMYYLDQDVLFCRKGLKECGKSVRIEDIDDFSSAVKETGGTVVYMKYSFYVEEDKILDVCDEVRSFYDKGKKIASVMTC